MTSDVNDDIKSGSKAIFYGILSAAAALFVVTSVYYILLPEWRDAETKGLEKSYTYVQTEKGVLVKLVQDYQKLESQQVLHKDEPDVVAALEGQKKATLDRIRSEAQLISPNEIPPSVLPYLGFK